MTQKELYLKNLEFEELREEYIEQLRKKFVGKNFIDSLDEIAETESNIEVKRNNVTFIAHFPRRTKRPKIEINKNCSRSNSITLPVKNKEWYKDSYNTVIKDIILYSCISKNKDIIGNKEITCIDGAMFILDDSEELVIDLK